MCVPAPRVSYRYRGKTYTVRYCIGVGQTFVEQTHNFPLFLLHNCTATPQVRNLFSKFSKVLDHPVRPAEPRISDRRYTLIHGNWKLSCSSRP